MAAGTTRHEDRQRSARATDWAAQRIVLLRSENVYRTCRSFWPETRPVTATLQDQAFRPAHYILFSTGSRPKQDLPISCPCRMKRPTNTEKRPATICLLLSQSQSPLCLCPDCLSHRAGSVAGLILDRIIRPPGVAVRTRLRGAPGRDGPPPSRLWPTRLSDETHWPGVHRAASRACPGRHTGVQPPCSLPEVWPGPAS